LFQPKGEKSRRRSAIKTNLTLLLKNYKIAAEPLSPICVDLHVRAIENCQNLISAFHSNALSKLMPKRTEKIQEAQLIEKRNFAAKRSVVAGDEIG
jgi:hypothetical protein